MNQATNEIHMYVCMQEFQNLKKAHTKWRKRKSGMITQREAAGAKQLGFLVEEVVIQQTTNSAFNENGN